VSGRDELAKRGLGNPDVPSDVNEADAPLLDQASREALGSAEDLGGFGHCKEPV
jgi:hypothetical protein